MTSEKVFNLSLHRSGSAGFDLLCRKLGFASQAWPGYQFDLACGAALEKLDAECVWQLYRPFVEKAGAFCDLPVPLIYPMAVRMYPLAKFLLIKKPINTWIQSVRLHTDGRELDILEKFQYWTICKRKCVHIIDYTDDELAEGYENHHQQVHKVMAEHEAVVTTFKWGFPDIENQIAAFCSKEPLLDRLDPMDDGLHPLDACLPHVRQEIPEVEVAKLHKDMVSEAVDVTPELGTESAESTDHGQGPIQGELGTSYLIPTEPKLPIVGYKFVPEDGHNVFSEIFGNLDDDEWADTLVRSITEPVQQGVHFPTFPDEEYQNMLHGNCGQTSIREATKFYSFVRENTYSSNINAVGKRVLDFGCGWGRIIRPFMRDFAFTDMFGFEPNFLSCAIARSLNPYVTFLAGGYTETGNLPEQFFHVVFAWSVFSHLSEASAIIWLRALAKAIIPGGYLVFTSWGLRFLERLQEEASRQSAGDEIHWYSSVCIRAAGSLEQRIVDFQNGKFVWFTSGSSCLYGETFLSRLALERLIQQYHLPFRIQKYDVSSLSQDAFVLIRQ